MKKLFLFLGILMSLHLFGQSNLELIKKIDISARFRAQKSVSYSFYLSSIGNIKPVKIILQGTDYDYDNDGDFTDFAVSINGNKLINIKSLTEYGLGKNGRYSKASFDISDYLKPGTNTIQLSNTENEGQIDYDYISWLKIMKTRQTNCYNVQNTATSLNLPLNTKKILYKKFVAQTSASYYFYISKKKYDTTAKLILTGYDKDYDKDGDYTEATISINGNELFSREQMKSKGLGSDGIPKDMTLDISPYIKQGNNVITISNTENSGQTDYFFLTAIQLNINSLVKNISEYISLDEPNEINLKFAAQAQAALSFYIDSPSDYHSVMLNLYGTDVNTDNDGDYTDFSVSVNNYKLLDAKPMADIGFGKDKTYDYHSFDITAYIVKGNNTIMLKNTENKGQIDYTFIKSVELKTEAKTNEAPLITITKPDLSRGFKIISQKRISIEGIANDKDGIASVTVNSLPAYISGSGYFSIEIPVQKGENQITVVATDFNNRSATKSFTITSGQQGQNVSNGNVQNKLSGNGKFYAIIIGVSDYTDPKIPDLLGEPTKDAQKLYDILTQKYTFSPTNVKLLKNPTYRQIIRSFDDLAKEVTENDNLVIFYAGHGDYDEKTNIGYWLPSDAEIGYTDAWLYNSVLVDNIKKIDSKHTLLLADACFSGSIFQTRSLMRNASMAIKKKYELKSRNAITSGTLKTVPNKSVFFKYLSNRLEENTQQFLSATELFQKIEIPVGNNSPNIPQFGDIKYAGDEGGDFIFIKK